MVKKIYFKTTYLFAVCLNPSGSHEVQDHLREGSPPSFAVYQVNTGLSSKKLGRLSNEFNSYQALPKLS
jgi:hypothetical protein